MSQKLQLIAETAWHHEGDYQFLRKLVDDLTNESKADIIKFHLSLDLDEYMDMRHSAYDTLHKWMIRPEQWSELINMTLDKGKELMLLLNDKKSIDFGMKFNPTLVEIHSVSINDFNLLEKLKRNIDKDQKIVLGIGGTDLNEIEAAINILDHEHMVLMFGFQNYPTRYEDINLKKIRKIMKLYPEFEFGYADHTAWDEKNNILITLLGAASGMNYIEKHVTNIYGEERCDWQAAVSIDMFNEISDQIEILSAIEGNGSLQLNSGEKKYSIYGPMKKTGLLKRDIKKGDLFTQDVVVFKRAGEESDCSQLDIRNYIGSTFSSDIKKDSVLYKKHFSKQ
jgi:N,N'-diacetyllegionaminate synthase